MKTDNLRIVASKALTIVLGAFLVSTLFSVGARSAYADNLKDYIVGDIYASIEDDPTSPGDEPIVDPTETSGDSSNVATLANTGDILPLLLAILALCCVGVCGVALYTRKKSTARYGLHTSSISYSPTQKIGLVLIAAALIVGTAFASTRALAEDSTIDDPKAGGRNVATITLNLKLTNDGYVKSAEMDIINKLIVDLQVEDIEAVFDFEDIIAKNLPIGEVIPAGESIHKSFELSGKVNDEVMNEIRNAEGGVFRAMVVTGVHYEGYESHFMMNDGSDTEFDSTDAPKGQDCLLPDKTPTRVGYRFDSWNTRSDGTGATVDAAYLKTILMTKAETYYAKWIPVEAFMAQVSSDLEMPCKIYTGTDKTTDIITVDKVKEASDTVRNGGSVDADIYSATNDKWHLFVKVEGDGSSVTDWMEMRIIHVGNHDNDGSAITFQAIHGLKEPVRYDTNYDNSGVYAGNWSSSTMREYLNGDFVNSLPSVVSDVLVKTTKKSNETAGTKPNGGNAVTTQDKVWILSFTEYIKDATTNEWSKDYWDDNSHDGSVYDFWRNKAVTPGKAPDSGTEQARLIGALTADRSGYRIDDRFAWERSLSPDTTKDVNAIWDSGSISARSGFTPNRLNYAAPSFAM